MRYAKERAALKTANVDRKWHKKVDAMNDQTVIAIYKRLKIQEKV